MGGWEGCQVREASRHPQRVPRSSSRAGTVRTRCRIWQQPKVLLVAWLRKAILQAAKRWRDWVPGWALPSQRAPGMHGQPNWELCCSLAHRGQCLVPVLCECRLPWLPNIWEGILSSRSSGKGVLTIRRRCLPRNWRNCSASQQEAAEQQDFGRWEP
jgi:hypothetical protein